MNKKILIILLVLVLFSFCITFIIYLLPPIITNIQTQHGEQNNTITIHGRFLGKYSPSTTLKVGNQKITRSHIILWQPSRIEFRIPYNMYSGNIVVTQNKKQSNAIFLSNITPSSHSFTQNTETNIQLRPVDDEYSSYWEVEGKNNLSLFNFYLDEKRIPAQYIFTLPEEKIGLYIPILKVSPNGNITSEDLLQRLILKPHDLYLNNTTFVLQKNRKNTTLINTASIDKVPLYHIDIIIPNLLENREKEYIVYIPLPSIENFQFSLMSSFPHWIQLLPFSDEHIRIRLLPHNNMKGKFTLKIYIDDITKITQPLPDITTIPYIEEYIENSRLSTIYEPYMISESEPSISTEDYDSLQSALKEIKGILPTVETMYEWFSNAYTENTIDNFINMLRQNTIAARKRTGYLIKDSTFNNSTSWLEFFLPHWGWVPIYGESIQEDLPFLEALHTYIPLPLNIPFPTMYNNQKQEIPIDTVIEFFL